MSSVTPLSEISDVESNKSEKIATITSQSDVQIEESSENQSLQKMHMSEKGRKRLWSEKSRHSSDEAEINEKLPKTSSSSTTASLPHPDNFNEILHKNLESSTQKDNTNGGAINRRSAVLFKKKPKTYRTVSLPASDDEKTAIVKRTVSLNGQQSDSEVISKKNSLLHTQSFALNNNGPKQRRNSTKPTSSDEEKKSSKPLINGYTKTKGNIVKHYCIVFVFGLVSHGRDAIVSTTGLWQLSIMKAGLLTFSVNNESG